MGFLFSLLGMMLLGSMPAMLGSDDDTDQDDDGVDTSTDSDGVEVTTDGNSVLMKGTDGSEALTGGDGNDLLFGNGGNDVSRGGDGNDLILDNEGADSLYGGAGDDLLVSAGIVNSDGLQDAADRLIANGGQLSSDVFSNVSFNMEEDSDTEGDLVNGGRGNDVIMPGENDTVFGGSGMDSIVVGDWVSGNEPVIVEDYDSQEDQLILSTSSNGPDITVGSTATGTGTEDALVQRGGETIMVVRGAGGLLTLNDLTLVDNS